MLLNKSLTINNGARSLIDERIELSIDSPGRAQFTIVSDDNTVSKNQLVTFDMGYSSQTAMQRWFIGVTDKVVETGDKRIKVFCRELSSALAKDVPLNLRHVTLRDVLAEISNTTGLEFSTPDTSYATTKVANFYNLGTGYQAMAAIERVFNISDYIWQQLSGVVYVGSWADSRWASVKNMILPAKIFNEHGNQNSAKLFAAPNLRPGVRINGNRINAIDYSGSNMVLKWT